MEQRPRKKAPGLPLPFIALGVILLIAAALIFMFQKDSSGGNPSLSVEPQGIDYGDVKLDTELSFEFKVTNQGSGVLRFEQEPYIELLEGC